MAFLKLVAFRLKELWERQKLCEIIIFTGRNLLLDLCVKCSCFWTGDAIWGIIITNINMKNFKTFISLLIECLVEDCFLLQKHSLLHYLLFAPIILSIATQLKSSNERWIMLCICVSYGCEHITRFNSCLFELINIYLTSKFISIFRINVNLTQFVIFHSIVLYWFIKVISTK